MPRSNPTIKTYVQHHDLVFPTGRLFPFPHDSAAMLGYLVPHAADCRKVTMKKVEDWLIEALTICHSNSQPHAGQGSLGHQLLGGSS